MKRVVAMGLVLLSACGPSRAGPAVVSPNPATSVSPSSSAPASPTASGAASVSFACKLPLSQFDAPSTSLRGGFVAFPAAAFSIDPNGAFEGVGAGGLVTTVTKPLLHGSEFGATYTRRYGRWLPASVAAVSPDSSHYAYVSGNPPDTGRIHVVDVASGIDRIVYSKDYYTPVDYQPEGIYVAAGGYADAPLFGLWLLNPTSGSLKPVASQDRTYDLIGGGAGWFGDLVSGDTVPNWYMGAKDRIWRMDLKSGGAAAWFYRPGLQLQAIGFDGQGHPVVMAMTADVKPGQGTLELWLLSAPGVGKKIYSMAESPDFAGSFGRPLADNHGLWFGSSSGVFLYTSDGKFRKVARAAGEIAGRCS